MLDSALETKAQFLHGFSHKTRIQILETLRTGEKTVSEIMETVAGSQSSISQHLACLRRCGIVVGRQEGKFMYYRLRNEKIQDLLAAFDLVLTDMEDEIQACQHSID